MGHITSKSYYDLQKRLDKSAQGVPESESLYKILEILFTEKEAKYASKLPIKFFTVKDACKRFKLGISETKEILNSLADKGILLDFAKGDLQAYILAPPMAGFFEFALMRTDGKFDRKILSELFYNYITKDGFFDKGLFGLKTPSSRTYVHEDKIKSEILDYEKASNVIKTASCITLGICYCRHKMFHIGKACDMPQETCMTFNNVAKSLVKHGIAKEISKKQAMEILDRCRKLGLVQLGDNVQEEVNWLCNCCGCCCEPLLAYKRLKYKKRINSNFFAKVDNSNCTKCKVCIKKCPVDAIELKNEKIWVDADKCIGCGVCSRFCHSFSIKILKRKKTIDVPKDSFERFIINAIEEGKIQNYVFDNYELWTNELLRHFLGVLVKLPPTKLLFAQKQLKSRFIRSLRKSKYSDIFNKLYKEGKKN